MESTLSDEKNASDEVKAKQVTENGNASSSSTPSVPVVDDELDALLNDALQDFGKVPQVQPPANNFSNNSGGHSFGAKGNNEDMNQVWTEEFIKEATAQFEKKMRECLAAQQQGGASSSGAASLEAVTQDLNRVVEAATKAAVGNVVEPSAVMSQINEAMKNVNLNPAVNDGDFNEDELAKLMSSFGMGGGGEGDDAELDEFLPFMTNFMQKLLSKDLLYPVLTDIVDRYPEWLADNRSKISGEEFDKYNNQYGYMKLICEEYASETPTDNDETKRKRFDRISELMIKIQYCGSPPKDLIGEDGTFPSMDPAAAFASMGMSGAGVGGPGGDQCSIV